MTLLGILFLVVALLVSVGIHELGHLVPAKRFGVKVSQYFIGFGPTLWSRRVNGTEYGIKLLPLGGFVRIAGMLPPGRPDRRTENRRGRLTLAEEARLDSAEEIAPGEEERAFWRLNPARKLVVMFGGPFTNLVLALVCLLVVLCGIGTPKPSSTVGTVSSCLDGTTTCRTPAPAAAAGMRPGDVIQRWGTRDVKDWKGIVSAIAASGTSPIQVRVLRDGKATTLTVTAVLAERKATDKGGSSVVRRPYVGISPAYERQRRAPTAVVGALGAQAKATAQALVRLPAGLWETGRSLITDEKRPANGIVGIVGVAGIAGDITSADSAAYDGLSRFGDLLLLAGSLNMTLFVFNLIPLLPLDGGHLAGATYEALRRRLARRRGRPDPGPVDTARLTPLSYGVAVAFIAMTALLVVADFVNPVSLF